MKVLIGCESSGVVRNAFRSRGYDAWSCDILPADDNSPYHLQCDVLSILADGWDLGIFHPPCTYLTVTANRWMKPEYAERFPDRPKQRAEAIAFFLALINAPIEKIAVENPVGIMSTCYRKPNQIIQPYQFGHTEAKKTCLWLKNLPCLKPTNIVSPEYVTFKSGKRMASWYVKAVGLPKAERTKLRSKTFEGIADAMAAQWG